jgi:hypothetical protein
MSDAWATLAAGGWSGPIRFEAAGVPYAGAVRLVDVDEDEHVAGAHAQARRLGGWGGVTAAITARPGDGDALALDADLTCSGEAGEAAGAALLEAVRTRLEDAARTPAAPVPKPAPSPADDPAWRRRLAARAALAVAVGAAAGLAGAAWGRRRGG